MTELPHGTVTLLFTDIEGRCSSNTVPGERHGLSTTQVPLTTCDIARRAVCTLSWKAGPDWEDLRPSAGWGCISAWQGNESLDSS